MTERFARIAIASALFVYVLTIRTYDVASTFLMLGEQTRDWTIALGGISELPLLGAPSTAGGRGLGPAYYWLLWLGRVTIGPFMDNLPHAGGVTVALLQSIGDTWLFVALSKRTHWALGLATCLLIASGPFDIAISSVIWNPPVAEALIKMALASALSSRPIFLTAALAWSAAQTHLSAMFVTAPLLLGVALQPLFTQRRLVFEHDTNTDQRGLAWRDSARATAIVATTIVVLQIPFLLSLLTGPEGPAGPTTAIATITSGQAWRPMAALDTVTGITGNLFLPLSEDFAFWVPSLIAGAIVVAVYRRDPIVIGGTIGAILTATVIFATWTRGTDRYWFLTMVPPMAVLLASPLAALPWRGVVMSAGVALTLLAASWQPARIAESRRFFEYPQYETMVRGSREILQRAPVVRGIRVAFEVHPTMDRQFVYKILGGRIDGSARYSAVINADGTATLTTE